MWLTVGVFKNKTATKPVNTPQNVHEQFIGFKDEGVQLLLGCKMLPCINKETCFIKSLNNSVVQDGGCKLALVS